MEHILTWDLISQGTARELATAAVPRNWSAGTMIFRQNSSCLGLHVLESGLLKFSVINSEGREQITHVQSEPGPLTVLPLFDGGPYSVNASALAPSRTWFLSRSRFEHIRRTRPDFEEALQRDLALKMRNAISLMGALSVKTVPARVAWHLHSIARRVGALDRLVRFNLRMSQEDLAHLVGTTRESVARAFAELRNAGIIEQKRSTISILDPGRLTALAEGASAAPELLSQAPSDSAA